MSERKQLGALLVEAGLLTEEGLSAALAEQGQTGKSLGRILIDMGLVTESDLVSTLAQQIGLEYVDLSEATIDPAAAVLITPALARRYQAMPIGWEETPGVHGGAPIRRLVVAMADPSNVFAIDDIRTITGAHVRTVVATKAGIQEAIDKHHRLDSDAENITAQASSEFEPEEDLSAVKDVVEDAPIVKLVNVLISQAVADRASDIHIEPTERDVRVRYRIDGVLHEVMRSPKNIQSGLISRLKIMSDLNIAERRVPQDGRMSGVIGGKSVDLRVATLPTVYGEKVVMRILDKSTALLDLKDLGFLPDALERYASAYRKPYGTLLVTGPTGSGKSTTLYATLNILNRVDRNIITVEDPVEYRLPGINQMQINSRAGLTFASALRSILRADPDIILIGEIRDRETSLIAIEAALTGHLVLSTLHTNDAPSSLTRLVEMGVETYLVASAIDCVVAQRLARKLCTRCRQAYRPDRVDLDEAGYPEFVRDEIQELFRPVGCSSCAKTGYRGRIGL